MFYRNLILSCWWRAELWIKIICVIITGSGIKCLLLPSCFFNWSFVLSCCIIFWKRTRWTWIFWVKFFVDFFPKKNSPTLKACQKFQLSVNILTFLKFFKISVINPIIWEIDKPLRIVCIEKFFHARKLLFIALFSRKTTKNNGYSGENGLSHWRVYLLHPFVFCDQPCHKESAVTSGWAL